MLLACFISLHWCPGAPVTPFTSGGLHDKLIQPPQGPGGPGSQVRVSAGLVPARPSIFVFPGSSHGPPSTHTPVSASDLSSWKASHTGW